MYVPYMYDVWLLMQMSLSEIPKRTYEFNELYSKDSRDLRLHTLLTQRRCRVQPPDSSGTAALPADPSQYMYQGSQSLI